MARCAHVAPRVGAPGRTPRRARAHVTSRPDLGRQYPLATSFQRLAPSRLGTSRRPWAEGEAQSQTAGAVACTMAGARRLHYEQRGFMRCPCLGGAARSTTRKEPRHWLTAGSRAALPPASGGNHDALAEKRGWALPLSWRQPMVWHAFASARGRQCHHPLWDACAVFPRFCESAFASWRSSCATLRSQNPHADPRRAESALRTARRAEVGPCSVEQAPGRCSAVLAAAHGPLGASAPLWDATPRTVRVSWLWAV